jgi:hypothetical protein
VRVYYAPPSSFQRLMALMLRSIGLRRWYINITITTLDNTYTSPFFLFKHDDSEARFCLRFQVEPTQLDPIDRANLSPSSRTMKTMKRIMVSSGELRRVALVRIDVSEEPGTSFIRVTEIGELGTTQAATSNRRTLRRNTFSSLNVVF